MIEKMKNITVLVSEQERDKFISKLRKEGVLHIKHAKAPSSHELSFVEDKISKLEKLISQLAPYDVGRPDRRRSAHERDVLSCADSATEDLKVRDELLEQRAAIKKQLQWFEDWGDFDPDDLEAVKRSGANIKLYRIGKKNLKEVQDKNVHVIKKGKTAMFVALVTNDEGEALPFDEVEVPEKSSDKLYQDITRIGKEIDAIGERMKERARGLIATRACKEKLEKELVSLEAKFGMQEEDKFSYIQGYCPVKSLDKITSMSEKHGLGIVTEDPDEPEETPTLITNPKWVDIISPVFTFMNTLPGYDEFDISFPFLAFFSIFFAMLIGDAGYGVLFLVVTFLARKKFKQLPGQPFFLMYLLSGCTIIWGAVTGTWFGSEAIQQLPLLRALVIPKLNSFSSTNQNFIIHICFTIGAIQLSLAHFMKAARCINSLKALSDAGWIMIVWGMFYTAKKFVLDVAFPPFAAWLLLGGFVLTLLFSNPEKGILKGIPATLINLPLSIIGSFSDVISYIRLFAVGLATVVVAESFNNMALGGGVNSVASGLIAAFILFFGHMLNIILGFMAVIVHGVRLNMLEFSGHLGMQWSGKKYEPFKE